MDELRMIATMLDEPPTPEAAARGRARLERGIHAPQRPSRRLSRPRLPLLAGLGAATTAAAVTGAVLLSSGTSPRAPDPVRAEPVSARTVLLTAARQAEAEAAPATGRYWHVRTLTAIPRKVGPKGDQYWMDKLMVSEHWARPDGLSWFGYREVGARPHTAEDKVKWARDGSPTKWTAGTPEPGDEDGPAILYGTPRPGHVGKVPNSRTFTVCDKELSLRQVQSLPTDPVALRTAVMRAMRTNDDGPVPVSAETNFLQGCLVQLLAEVPVPPKVRGAAYRLLAAWTAVKVTGRTADERGRAGIGLLLGGSSPPTRLVIDPKSSHVLSEWTEPAGDASKLTGKSRKRLYLQVGWTDAKPAVPALP
ncbi:CU044_5270 family protein [Actinomadura rubrisoli]|uniref:CU044_5270 family protein n=1 Tax=Actinomadura rubrisoli TaxID=2530368 RepID=A0A4R5BPL2_9ACTN|nr:CU044_5270 family protein [Actinomadura rubrisoli]TDD87386.1 hypothetical protein E1298_16140 [Actinomadura rubrisoli]